MSETFGIQVQITPDVEPGKKKIDQALEHVEQRAREAGDVASKALAKGFEDAAAAAVAAAKKEKDALAELTDTFRKLERSTVAAVRAEHDYAEAERLTTAAVKAGIATQQQANTILSEKAKAFELTTVRMQAHNQTFGESVSGWLKAKSSAMEVVGAVGKIGMALEAVNKGVMIAGLAWNGFGKAVDFADRALGGFKSSAEDLRKFIDAGGLRGASEWTQNVVNAAANRVGFEEQHAYNQAGGWAGAGLPTADTLLDATIEGLNDLTAKGLELERQKSQEITNQNNSIAEQNLMKRRNEQEALRALIAAKAEAKAAREAAAARGPKRVSDYDSMAAHTEDLDWSAVSGVNSAIAAAREWYAETERALALQAEMMIQAREWGATFEAAVHDAGDAFTDFFADADENVEKSTRIVEEQVDHWQNLADVLSGPVSGAFDGLLDGMLRWEMSWKEWGQAASSEIAKVIAKMLLLQAIEAAFNAGWLNSSWANGLSSLFGGGPVRGTHAGGPTGSSSRTAPGDPFGGAAGGSGAVFREPVMRQAPSGGPGGGGASGGNVKVVVVADMTQAAREFATSAEGERVTIQQVQKNSSKLRAASR